MTETVPIELAGLRERVAALEGTPLTPSTPSTPPTSLTPISAVATTPAAEQDFLRMDNPWMWAGVAGLVLAIVGLWWFMGRNKMNNDRGDGDDEDDDEPQPTAPAWPQQTTPKQEYARHYGAIY